MLCSKCGQEIPDESSICPCCGNALVELDSELITVLEENEPPVPSDEDESVSVQQAEEEVVAAQINEEEAAGVQTAVVDPDTADQAEGEDADTPPRDDDDDIAAVDSGPADQAEGADTDAPPKDDDDLAVVNTSQASTVDGATPTDDSPSVAPAGKSKKTLYVAVAIVAAIIAIFLFIGESNKNALKDRMKGTWHDTDGTIIKVLEVTDSTITYRLETQFSFLDTTLGTYEWKPTSGHSFKMNLAEGNWRECEVEFLNNDKGMMLRPALTSTDSYELWVDIS